MKKLIVLMSILVMVALMMFGAFGCGGSSTSSASATGGKAVVKVVDGGVQITNPDGSTQFIAGKTIDVATDGGNVTSKSDANNKTF